jgi:glycosyltransferase involved in cell wall biosynthesis
VLKRTILHLRSSRSVAGPERHLLELLPGLAARGLEVEAALLYRRRPGEPARHPLLDELAAAGVASFQIADPDRPGRQARAALAERLRRGDVAALHGHDPKSDWVLSRARRAAGGSTAGPPRRLATLHLYTRATLPLRLYRRLDLALVRRFDGVVAVTPALAKELAGRAAACPVACRVIPNGIDGERLRARAAAGLASLRRELDRGPQAGGSPLLVAAGRLTRQKGIDLLLAALPALVDGHPGLQLCIAGDGPERRGLAAQVRELGLGERVRFLGERADLPALLAAADLFVLPSRNEGSPYVLLEALALGRPIVATAVGDVAATLAGVADAGLVPAGDTGALAAAIDRRLRAGGETAGPAGSGGEAVGGRRSAARMADETAAFYADLLP